MKLLLLLLGCIVATVTAGDNLIPYKKCNSLNSWYADSETYRAAGKAYHKFILSLCENSNPRLCQCPKDNVEELFMKYLEVEKYEVNPYYRYKIHEAFEEGRLKQQKCGIGRPLNIDYSSIIKPSDFPWLALLEYKTSTNVSLEPKCGGVLISEDTVLTAARCLSISGTVTHVRLGEYNVEDTAFGRKSNAIRVPVANVIVHEDYYSDRNEFYEGLTNDIAIIKLANKVKSNDYVSPICLPSTTANKYDRYLIAGWGIHTNYSTRATNKKVGSNIFKDAGDECSNSHELNYIANVQEHICISSAKHDKDIKSNPCIGDSGGPLMTYNFRAGRYVLQGISAVTSQCSKSASSYGLYTRVFEVLPWIQKFIK